MKPSLLLLLLLFGVSEILGAQHLPQIYVHTDRSMYLPGDTVWFKAYILAEGHLNPKVSNLYIDWADSSGRVLENNVYIASEGYSLGQYVIPDNYPSPFLYLNAYTGNIADKSYLGYSKSLHILGDNWGEGSPEVNERLIMIRPASGQLVKGLNNTLAMRSEQRNGMPFRYKAELLDGNYDVIASTVSDTSGIASLSFVPGDSKYAIRWDDGKGVVRVEALPSVQHEGVAMEVVVQNGNRLVALRPSPGISGDYVLRARLNQEILFEQQLHLEGKALNVAIPDDILSYGLLQLDLQDNNGESYAHCAEVVGQHAISVVPEVKLLASEPGAKGLQKIRISFPEGLADANLSVSITDVFSLPDSSDTMVGALLRPQMACRVALVEPSALWAGTVSWNREYGGIDSIPDPADRPLEVRAQLRMSDKGWERFDKAVASRVNKGAKGFVPADAVSIGYRPVRQDTVNYPFQYTHAVPDADRRITIEGLQFFDTMEFRLSHIEHKMQFTDLEAEYLFKPFRDHAYLNVPRCHLETGMRYLDRAVVHMGDVDASFAAYLRNAREIETVVVTRKVKPAAVRDMEDKFGVSDWFKASREDYLPQQDPYVIKYSANLSDYLNRQFVRMGQFKRVYLNEVLVKDYLGMQISEADRMRWEEALGLDMSWIGLVKVLNGAWGDELAVYQLAPSDVNRDLGRKIQFNKVMGYSPIHEVQHVSYSSDNAATAGRDERQTLYWHPLLLKTANDRFLDIEFPNNDFGRGYWINVKGVTADGKLVDYVEKIDVQATNL